MSGWGGLPGADAQRWSPSRWLIACLSRIVACSFSGSTPPAPGGFSFGAKYVSTVQAAVGSAGCSGGSGGGAGASDAAVRGAAIIPADLDGELAQQLQKLSKRDATTKLKALQVGRQTTG